MTAARARFDRIVAERPEAGPWLGLLGRARREAEEPTWAAAVPYLAGPAGQDRPLLSGAVLRVDRAAARRWVHELIDLAAASAHLRLASREALDPLTLLEAALGQSHVWFETAAAAAGVQPGALRTLAELAAFPLLQACGRHLAGAVGRSWWEGYCPVCGAWPVLAESRGVERSRRLRCGRCGGDWETDCLRCPFCGTRDHARLGALVPEGAGERRRIETCSACSGYLKVLTMLTATGPADVLLEDLASVDLDLAALAEGYVRPEGLGYPLGAMVVERPGLARRLLGRAR